MNEVNLTILEWLSCFKYWPETIALLGSIGVAWFTAWRTSRSEILKLFRSKRTEAYEEVLGLFARLIHDGQAIFDAEFSAEAATIELKVKTYGSKIVGAEFSKAYKELINRRNDYVAAEAALESKYMPSERVYDKDGVFLGLRTRPMIDVPEYEELLEREKTARTLSICELNTLFQPTIDAIRDSCLKAKD
ncbi:MAG: hypothetical protein Q4B45_08315 [Coriobacteriia bacterium]|nr:hypothetical protein [Coriobacteriia bacterium]